MTIANDKELRSALEELSIDQQRSLGSRFVTNVISLTENSQLSTALETASDSNCSNEQRESSYKAVKSIAVQTYTACGRDADWKAQAEHFVATACAAAITPDSQITEKMNLAWRAAIQARMARNCIMMDAGDDELQSEAEAQYRIAEAFI